MSNQVPPAASALPAPSAFLHIPDTVTYSATPSILHLKRDLLLPVSFQVSEASKDSAEPPAQRDGRSAGSSKNGILNTRFGDFPHASIIGQPYGSQVRATNLGHSNRKRKRRGEDGADGDEEHNASGFLHVLAPTAELWTASLPHRTQVVYTPDSSFILHKLGVHPGSVLIEAGAGSGSFTHAGVRAVYRGYPDGREGPGAEGDIFEEKKRVEREGAKAERKGRVWSFEFHKERVGKLKEEIGRHGLDGLVEVVHRDVCKDGFLIKRRKEGGRIKEEEGEEKDTADVDDEDVEFVSPEATAIFLDLPAPWLALPHLTRKAYSNPSLPTSTGLTPSPSPAPILATSEPVVTATIPLQDYLDPTSTAQAKLSISSEAGTITLNPGSDPAPTPDPITSDTLPSALSQTETVRICTFSPCIEQVTRTVSVLRKLGWVEIEMHEIQHRRIEVRRSNRRGYEDGAGPRSVTEAVNRLKWVGEYRNTKKEKDAMQAELDRAGNNIKREEVEEDEEEQVWKNNGRRERKSADAGMRVTRIEPEVKSHTSYLVFAVLPREWSEEEEATVRAYVKATTKGVIDAPVVGEGEKWKWATPAEGPVKVSKRQLKKMEKEARKTAEGSEAPEVKVEVGIKKESSPAAEPVGGAGEAAAVVGGGLVVKVEGGSEDKMEVDG